MSYIKHTKKMAHCKILILDKTIQLLSLHSLGLGSNSQAAVCRKKTVLWEGVAHKSELAKKKPTK